MCDVKLFDGLDYGTKLQHDHFFSDMLRKYADYSIDEGDVQSADQLFSRTNSDENLRGVLLFWDGISAKEDRLRWDRVVCLHLLLICFLDSFGFPRHAARADIVVRAQSSFKHDLVWENFCSIMELYDLSENRSFRRIQRWKRSWPE